MAVVASSAKDAVPSAEVSTDATFTKLLISPGLGRPKNKTGVFAFEEFYLTQEFADVAVLCAEERFLAHRVVLSAKSSTFKQVLAEREVELGKNVMQYEIHIADVVNPEAVKIMIDHLYGVDDLKWVDCALETQEIKKDVLRVAQRYGLHTLEDLAISAFSQNISTANVVERLAICEEFGLQMLQGKIMEQLTLNRKAFHEVANSPQIVSYPKLMSDMLQVLVQTNPSEEQVKHRKRQ